jgi:hypothetical protein
MKAGVVIAIVAALVAGIGLGTHPEILGRIAPSLAPGGVAVPTGAALSAAGVHKCQGAGGVLYVDHACPPGTRELAANGGSVNVMAFPKPAPASSATSGAGLIQGMSREEVDRLRDRMIEQAANR